MSLNTTHVTGPANSGLTHNLTAHHISGSTHDWKYASASNLGYGVGRIVRGAFEALVHAWQRMWTQEPSSEELALRKQNMIFRHGLKECVQRLDSALDNVYKNPQDFS